MTARTISERANWDGRLNQQRQSSKWRRTSNFARDPPPQSRSTDDARPPDKFSYQKRVQQSSFRPNLERGSLSNSPANARLSSRADTTSTPSQAMHHSRPASIAVDPPLFPHARSSSRSTQHTTPNPALRPSPFISSSKSSYITPDSSVHASRLHSLRTSSSRQPFAPSQSASTMDSEVIDLTQDDTQDELSVGDMLVPNSDKFNDHHADPGPSGRTLSSGRSSPMAPEQSLFTPPPSRKRRLRFDYLAVPPFPKGLTKADYRPMSDSSVVPPPDPVVTGAPRDPPPAEPPVVKVSTPKKWKGKEREHDIVSSRKRFKERLSANGVDAIANVLLDASCKDADIPLHDDDIYPSLTALDLLTNTRFQFAHTWREHASKLQEAELDWMSKFKLLGKSCVWVLSENRPSPRLPGTAGYVSVEQLRPWDLVPPDGPVQDKNTDHVPNEQVHAAESQAVVEVLSDHLSPPDDAPPGPSAPADPAPSNPTTSQGSAALNVEHDMHQYFNGLGDSPPKHAPPHQTLTPAHTFRPHLLQSSQHAQINSLDFGFPLLELDPGLADTSGRECFLGLPPSPPPADVEPPTTPIPDHPLECTDDPPSPSNVFDTSPTDVWSSFSQGEGLRPESDSPPTDPVGPTSLSTINPSLLGVEKSQQRSPVPKGSTQKRRSKLPEPVIYIRRPVDSSSLPLRSGKRSVQIKYRDSADCLASSTETPSKHAENSERLSDAEDSIRPKRHSLPSRKLREYRASTGSDSDYAPEASTSTTKLKLKPKRSSLRDKESIAEHQYMGTGTATTVSSCHQCRRATERPKMLCSNVVQGRVCGKRFCNRCILYRYPEVTFDQHSAGFLCPVCTNTCNCSYCSRNRGEEFVSMRLGGLATALFKTKVTFVRDGGEAPHRAQSPPPTSVSVPRRASTTTTPTPEPGALPKQSQFWAHVYGIEGERMGSAFMSRGHVGLQPQGPTPPPLPKKTSRKKKLEKPRGPRVFVGRPLESWKLRAVRDLEPNVDVGVEREGGGEGVAPAGRWRRRYVGNRARLYEPYGRMASPAESRCTTPALDSDGSLTPLSELEAEADDWPQPDVGEYCSWAPPPPPGSVVRPGLSGPFSSDLLGSGAHGAAGTGPDASGAQALGSGSGAEMEVDGGDEPASPSTTLSQEELARAIGAALAALGPLS